MKYFYYCYFSPIGKLHLYADEKFLIGVYFKNNIELTPFKESIPSKIIQLACHQLDEYFSCKRTEFSIPLKVIGTTFQKDVWQSLVKIPYGKTKSYGEIAKDANHPKAARAVGTANKINTFPIFIPCHRVIKSSGDVGEYAGGRKVKIFLLKLEKTRDLF